VPGFLRSQTSFSAHLLCALQQNRLVSLTSHRLPFSLLSSPLSVFTSSFVAAVDALTLLSLSHIPHSKTLPNYQIFVEIVGDLIPSDSSIISPLFVGIFVVDSTDRVIVSFSLFLTRSNTVIDYLKYLFKDIV
jgi:hypothetical protein